MQTWPIIDIAQCDPAAGEQGPERHAGRPGTRRRPYCREPCVRRLAARWHRDESAASMVEYGLLVAVIAVAVMAAAQPIASQVGAIFSEVRAYIAGVTVPPSP
jgi:pilus assembly protein Flp/PilA